MPLPKELIRWLRTVTYPRHRHEMGDLTAFVAQHIVTPFAPPKPPIDKTAPIACIGSCFAENMANALAAQGAQVIPLCLQENLNNAFAVNYFVHYALEGKPFPEGFLPPYLETGSTVDQQLRNAQAFIVTFGLSACWFEKFTGRMVLHLPAGFAGEGWRERYDNFEMRLTSVEDNVRQMMDVLACIRRCRPDAPVVLTLSPIPLQMGMSGISPISSNFMSKGTLRLALHDVMSRNLQNIFYWPAFEIIEWVGKHDRIIWGMGKNDLRHPEQDLINSVMAAFGRVFFK